MIIHLNVPTLNSLSGGPADIVASRKSNVTVAAAVKVDPCFFLGGHSDETDALAAADPLPDPPDPLFGDTVDAASMVAPTTDAATMAMPCA